MRKYIYTILLSILVISCTKEKIDFDYVTSKFKENSNKINIVQYNDQRIDSSMAQNVFWNNKGFAVLEKNPNDKFFGYSFYGKREDIDKEYLYDNDNGFEISRQSKEYGIRHPFEIIGSPGGQMTVKHIFSLDSVYQTVDLTETKEKYILKYTFENDTIYNVTDQSRVVELRKTDFFPIKITYRSKMLGKSTMNQHILSDIKINDDVSLSIDKIKNIIADYNVVQEEKNIVNPILNNKFPEIRLPKLTDNNDIVSLNTGKLILIDFWEVWCGPCIKSFPKVEELNKKYKEKVQVLGIVSESRESAIKLVEKKGVTFTNLFGNKEMHKKYGVNSYPRYFLINKDGIVINEYFGFSDEIETDINELLNE